MLKEREWHKFMNTRGVVPGSHFKGCLTQNRSKQFLKDKKQKLNKYIKRH